MTAYVDIPLGVADPDRWEAQYARALSSGWTPILLAPVAAGGEPRPTPTVGIAPDGSGGLLYPGRRHAIVSESEAGKSWLAMLQVQAEAARGNHALVIDFEDDEHGFTSRAIDMGIPVEHLDTLIHYYRPDSPIDTMTAPIVGHMLRDWQPSIVVCDGITDGMGLHGLNPLDNKDVAAFSRLLLRPLTETGAALVALDHVTKSSEGRGRYALGGVHKLNDVNGAQFLLDNRQPFGHGLTGRSGLFVGKDRPGLLRALGRRSAVGYWIGDLVGESLGAGALHLNLLPPPEKVEAFRPTVLMERVRDAIRNAPEPLTTNGILDRVQGKAQDVRTAIACLVDDREVIVEKGPNNSRLHRLVEP